MKIGRSGFLGMGRHNLDMVYRLFEMGFGEQVGEIVRRLPSIRQTVLFSATLPKLLVEFTKAGLHDPTLIR
jgi:ATP-dependent RNA helicase DDX54/DBP10